MPAPWTEADRSRIARRRRAVEAMSNRGLKLWEISEGLIEQGIINPKTQEPYTKATISRDLKANEELWLEEIVRERGLHKGRQLSELREARRKAWADGDISEVRLLLQLEIKLMGTDAPLRLEIDWQEEAREAGLDPADVFEQYVAAAAAALDQSAGTDST